MACCSFSDVIDVATDDELDEEVYVGVYRGDIVGIRYYHGQVNNNEMVSLVREPRNPYDRNAVRVDNVRGIQVGHIKRELARALADVVDKGLSRLEGLVPFGKTNIFQMSCDISFWSKSEHEQIVLNTMRRYGYVLRTMRDPAPSKSVASRSSYQAGIAMVGPPAIRISKQEMKGKLDNLFSELEVGDKTATMEPAEVLKTELFPYQKQALAWMIACENSQNLPPFWKEQASKKGKEYFNSATNYTASKQPECVLGGILADDMGLGKTLEVISLIVTNFHNKKPLVTVQDWKPETPGQKAPQKRMDPRKRRKKKKSFDEEDWEEEEEEDECVSCVIITGKQDPDFVPTLTAQVNCSQQPIRRSSRVARKMVKHREIVIDEDETVEDVVCEPKKPKKAPKQKGKNKSRGSSFTTVPSSSADAVSVMEEQLVDAPPLPNMKAEAPPEVSHAALVSPTAGEPTLSPSEGSGSTSGGLVPSTVTKTPATCGPRPTLVVCPLSVMSNWQDQLNSHVYPGLLDVYMYYGSDRTKKANVLADQDIVLTTYQTLASEFTKGNSPLVNLNWLRVVLDEGHIIRNPNAQMSKAAHALKAERRWVVTGTPIQNSMKDLWSIICFLKLEPFTDRQWWRRSIERPLSEGDESALGRVQALMRSIAMRRTKDQKVNGQPLVQLPERHVFLQPIELSLEERKLYDSVAKEGRTVIGKYFKAGTVLNNYADVLAILMRLRQLCCHPKLCAKLLDAARDLDQNATLEELRQKLISSLMTVLSSGTDEECPICLDSLTVPVITHCAHVFCRRCIQDVIQTTGLHPRCPLCRADVSLNQLVDVPVESENSEEVDWQEEWHSSSKVDALMCALTKQRSEDPSIKSLVVSQFTAMLTLVETPLKAEGFKFVRLDGTMSLKRRSDAMEEFADTSAGSPTVFLLSLKAGGVGLNLTAASRVFLLDPAWNPATEEQCFDRCHRLGQTKDVVVTKFVVKDSVEERMLELQKKKRDLMTGAFKNKPTAEQKRQQRIRDVKTLMDF